MIMGADVNELMLTASLAASRKRPDAIDKAFIRELRHYPRAKNIIGKYRVIHFQPFDSVPSQVSADVESPDGERILCVKGAPNSILRTVCEETIPPEVVEEYNSKVNEFASRGFRTLGVARQCDNKPWEILGIVPLMDHPRYDTARMIKEAKSLGLSIKLLTGDAVNIARETARQLGLETRIYNSEKLGLGGGGDMPGSEMYDFVQAADGFAEVFPHHKGDVVEILQQRSNLVAMTGDGINDIPSLTKANVGIAVAGASDAARSAADIILTAPGLSPMVETFKTSRQIFQRM